MDELLIPGPCDEPKTNAEKIAWPYIQYYIGERDQENRKNGEGEHHWSGAQSLAWYTGALVRDTMHGVGDYRCRYRGPNHTATTYEGHFYNNEMHGYGAMSYPDGRVFNGLYHRNIRWGPGIESFADLHENVGFWNGTRLIRLAWRPPAANVAVDLCSSSVGKFITSTHRTLLMANTKNIGEVNTALELLKHYGAKPLVAAEKWTKLYTKHCTDTASLLCHVDVFDDAYYEGQIHTLEVISQLPIKNEGQEDSTDDKIDDSKANLSIPKIYYAWNNNEINKHMMKHCFKHEKQRPNSGLQLIDILNGPRSKFKYAGQHEMDCRMLLMASYLGHVKIVARLINESNVHPNLTDVLGNSAVMYAACGDQPEILHFLVEAGASIDGYNDSCCTPLGVTLLRYACTRREISPSAIIQAVLPQTLTEDHKYKTTNNGEVTEWNINRDANILPLQKRASAISKTSKTTLGKDAHAKKKETTDESGNEPPYNSVPINDVKRFYLSINCEYASIVNELYDIPNPISPVPYIFDVFDMLKEINTVAAEDDLKKVDKTIKKAVPSKVLKGESKISKTFMNAKLDQIDKEMDMRENLKKEREDHIMSTILELLASGADPRNVRCPYSAVFIATVAGCPDLVRHLARYGADVNQVCSETLGYSPLDVAVSGPLTDETVQVVRSLLESGANANNRLSYPMLVSDSDIGPVLGPTLLHAVLAKMVDYEGDEDLRIALLELLLEYGCNPLTRFRGRSSVDIVMSKNFNLLDMFIKNPRTNLNGIINEDNQTILVKMFSTPFCHTLPSTDRIQTLTNLLLFGADPLLKCQNGDDKYDNLFVYAKNTIMKFDTPKTSEKVSPPDSKKAKPDPKPKKVEKNVPPKGPANKSKVGDLVVEVSDYKQALDLVVECARLLYIRWVQAKVMKSLIELVDKYSHRHWNIIMNEHKKGKCTGLWLTPARCLEIWDILKTTKKKLYTDRMTLRYVMCIVNFYNKKRMKQLKGPKLSFEEKGIIETEVVKLLHEHKLTASIRLDMEPLSRPYVAPELTVNEEKFNVCFECILPLKNEKILCSSCKLVSFCSLKCIKFNTGRPNCHPCSDSLKKKYFMSPEESEINNDASVIL